MPDSPALQLPALDAESLRQLAREVGARDLPAFGLTLRELFAATDSDNTSGRQIADIVLRDPALTSRVLRAANSAHIGLGSHARVVTVTRAVVVLGFNPIRSLCVSALTVEAMAAGPRLARRAQESLGRSLHAAVQARDLGLRLHGDKAAAEQLFVEALLSGIGELAFWCFGAALAQRVDQALRASGAGPTGQSTLIGSALQGFGRELLRAWGLDAVLRDSPEVRLARRLSQVAGPAHAPGGGWSEPGVDAAVQDIARLCGRGARETLAELRQGARQALQLALALGAHDAAANIPASDGALPAPPAPQAPATAAPAAAAQVEADAQQQVRVLTEMGQVAQSRKDIPLLLRTCLEGLHRTVGLDRCVLCLLNAGRTRLGARMVIGPDSEVLREALQWDWSPEFQVRARLDAPRWCAVSADDDPLLQASGARQGFVAPFCVDAQLIGVFYADRLPSGRALGAEQYDSFQSFIALAELVVRGLPRPLPGA